MSNQKENTPDERAFAHIITLRDLKNKYQQNLFSANHRNRMLSIYGYTQAQSVTINDLI